MYKTEWNTCPPKQSACSLFIFLVSIHNEMTTPKNFHDVTTPRKNWAGFIIADLLQIITFSQYVYQHVYQYVYQYISALMFPL